MSCEAASASVALLRQVEDAAVAREDEDAGAEELLADELHKLVGVLDVVVPVADDLQPRQRRRPRPLARPVRRRRTSATVCIRRGADLHLEGLRADEDGGVQRAVAVGLRARDVVLQRARQRRPPRVDLAQHVEAEGVLVALGELLLALGNLRVQHDAEGDEVVDPLDAVLVALHLLRTRGGGPTAIDRLGAPRHADGAHAAVATRRPATAPPPAPSPTRARPGTRAASS